MVEISDFRKWAKTHKNFMTPDILKVRKDGNYFVELSVGDDFDHKPMYGVTIVHWAGDEFTSQGHIHSEKSKSFSDKAEAYKYYRTVI